MKVYSQFNIKGKEHTWELEVRSNFLKLCTRDECVYLHESSTVKEFFEDLGIVEYDEFLEKVYGHSPASGAWPEWIGDDDVISDKLYQALNNLSKSSKVTIECEELFLL